MITEIINGIPVDNVTNEEILNSLPTYLNQNMKMTIVSINPQIVIESKNYPEILRYIEQGTYRIADGIGLILVSKITKGNLRKRVTGYDLMKDLLQYADDNQKSCFFYGAKPEILASMIKNLAIDYPNLRVSGAIDGYTNLTDKQIVQKINSTQSDFVFVALGFPKQEQWLAKHYKGIDAKVFQDVGGSFDVLSGHVKRAPDVFIKFHIEWLYRSLSNPKRIGRIFQLPVFLFECFSWHLSHKNQKK